MTLKTRLDQAVGTIEGDAGLLHQIVHGDDQTTVTTQGGQVKSVANVIPARSDQSGRHCNSAGHQCGAIGQQCSKLCGDGQHQSNDSQRLRDRRGQLRNCGSHVGDDSQHQGQ